MSNLQRAIEFYARTSGRYGRLRPHGIREPVLAWQRKGIVELAAPRPTDSVLDVGCGAGQIAALLRPMVASICGVDASKEMVALARRWLDEEAHAHSLQAADERVSDSHRRNGGGGDHGAPTGRKVAADGVEAGRGILDEIEYPTADDQIESPA